MSVDLNKAIRDRALQLRHYAAIEACDLSPNVNDRYELLIQVVAPSVAVQAASEERAREELYDRLAAKELVA